MLYQPIHEEKWNTVIDSLRNGLPKLNFNQWIEPIKLFAVKGMTVMGVFEDDFGYDVVMRRYFSQLDAMVKTVFGQSYEFKLLRQSETGPAMKGSSMLNPAYTFENFIKGGANSLAFAASVAVAEEPANMYNPLFIHGDVGLGKTHLMNAIGNYIIENDPTANVLLTTSESFTNELIETIVKKRGGPEFRAKMRSLDVLMVDDIQFFGKTTATQEEFFHTFNELMESGKQIVLSSDRPPNELPTLEERLRSRFAAGLIVDIQRPDFETRIAILKQKCDTDGIDISYEAVEYIAAHFDRSIRDLQGALTRVQAFARLMDREDDIDLALTQQALQGLATTSDSRVITPKRIMEATAKKFGVTVEDLIGKKRSRDIAVPRQVAIFLCREMTDLSTTNIGREFGDRDHTTVMHSCEKISSESTVNAELGRQLAELRSEIRGA